MSDMLVFWPAARGYNGHNPAGDLFPFDRRTYLSENLRLVCSLVSSAKTWEGWIAVVCSCYLRSMLQGITEWLTSWGLWRSSCPTHPEQAAQDHAQASSEHLQGGRLHSLIGPPVPAFSHPRSENVSPCIQTEPPVFWFVSTASCFVEDPVILGYVKKNIAIREVILSL